MVPEAKSPSEDHAKRGSRLPHLIPALIALLILVGAILYADRYASALEDRYIHAIGPLLLPQSVIGSVLQQAAFRQPDLLPIYGSSEMLNVATPFRAFTFFAAYPTGFDVFDVAKAGDTSLDIAQDLAAIGPELKGKKVVISFTPSNFNAQEVSDKAYAASFSRMHAYALAFSPNLSMVLKQRIALRMLAYPDTLAHDPLLSFALHNLAGGAFYQQIIYYLVFPLGQLDTLVIRMQDHYAVWSYLQSHPEINPAVLRTPQTINWNAEIDKAKSQEKAATNSNPYGIENNTWIQTYHQVLDFKKPGSGDQGYLSNLESTKEWGDLESVLEVLQELGAQPLIMSRPINGILYTAEGISPQAQQVYYIKLQDLASSYRMPLVDFPGSTIDPYFSIDQFSHSSPEGWAIVDQRLDAFYHGNIH